MYRNSLKQNRAEKELELAREQQKLHQYSNCSVVNNHELRSTDSDIQVSY